MTTPNGDDTDNGHPTGEEEPSGGSLSASAELEQALREAEESVDAREAAKAGAAAGGPESADKMLLEAMSNELQLVKEKFEGAYSLTSAGFAAMNACGSDAAS